MLKEILAIEGVGHSFEVTSGSIAVITTEGNCMLYQGLKKENHKGIDGMFSGLGIYSENEFYLSEGFTSKIINADSFSAIEIPYKVEAIEGNRIISSQKEERTRYLISSLEDGSIEWKIVLKRGKHMLLDQKILVNSKYLDDGILNGYNLSNGSILWTLDITKLGVWKEYDGSEKSTEITKILGIQRDQIYIYLNSSKILILDLETGANVMILENNNSTKAGDFGFSIELDSDNNQLIQLARQDLIQVDLSTMEVVQTPIEAMKSLNIENVSPIVYDGNHIYFTDKNEQTLGALNRFSKKIDWTYHLSQEDISESEQPRFAKELKLRGGLLYVLDNKNTLHIFDRQYQPA